MRRIASPIDMIREHYTVVVVGSGYGGGVTASRLARAGQSVCLLERGKEMMPGELPDSAVLAAREMNLDTPSGHVGSRTGLFNFHVDKEMNVLTGCGLGGTSLINANVSIRPDAKIFAKSGWPAGVRADVDTLLDEGYRRAWDMLEPGPLPSDWPTLAKTEAHKASGEAMGQPWRLVDINVHYEDRVNAAGVRQRACINCGDCVSGCNYRAKNTTQMNYLPDAHAHGAEIFCEVSVRSVERQNGRWLVHYEILGAGRARFRSPEQFVTADVVVLSAGTLGSTQILLRSREAGLPTSELLGLRFSGNGDALGFSYSSDRKIHGVGFGDSNPDSLPPVGPCITSVIDMRGTDDVEKEMILEEGSVPGPIGGLVSLALGAESSVSGIETNPGVLNELRELVEKATTRVRGPHHGAMDRTQVYLVMAMDDDHGELSLEDDRLRIRWPGVGTQPAILAANERMEEATRALKGVYVHNPIWSSLFHKSLITVHPLGGCILGDTAEDGVVDHRHRVFADRTGAEVHDGLYVSDGAVIPTPLAVNPLLTITALAERCAALIARDRGWTIDYAPPTEPLPDQDDIPLGVRFTETMHGFWSEADDFEAGSAKGKASDNRFRFVLTIQSDNLEKTLADPASDMHMTGTVEAPGLSERPMLVSRGIFNLFVPDPGAVETQHMRYRMTMSTEDGRHYTMEGHKNIHNDRGFDGWTDTTTLFVTVYEGSSCAGPVLGRGILRLTPADFARQLTTMQVLHAPDFTGRLEALARFGRMFAGNLWDIYGGIAAHPTVFDPDAPPRVRRPLRVGAPELSTCTTSDGLQLRLTRYRGGSKGPVMLVPGLGVSSRIFAVDTIDTNLLEYLYADGYDCWLFDFRASIALESAQGAFSGDDIATKDFPAAVDAIRRATGADTIQVVAHCYGATTFTMALLAGLQGVRSAVLSQVSAHMRAPTALALKAGLHVPGVLDALGLDTVTAYTDTHTGFLGRVVNELGRLYPVPAGERCHSDVCHRISLLYSLLYQHEQLNDATHATLAELFGIASVQQFKHLTAMIRAGHLVSADGEDIYMPHLDRLALPLTFIHGGQNDCFLPESTLETWQAVCARNGSELYSRHVVPNYGHIDCIFGKDAARDVFPLIADALGVHAADGAP